MILMTDDLVETYEIHYEDILAMEINNTKMCDVEDRVWQVLEMHMTLALLSFGLLISAVAKNVDVCFVFEETWEKKIN
jgi:hypothetical protein